MSTASTIGRGNANSGGAKTGIDFSVLGIGLDASSAITAVCKVLETRKTWGFLADYLNVTERVAKHRLAGSRAYTVDELRTLLKSEDGLAFLEALMDDAEPKWWWWAKHVITVGSIKRRRAEDEQAILKLETSAPAEVGARRRIKGALDANRNIKAAIDRAETTLGFRNPNMAGEADHGTRGSSRVSHRAVAQAKGRR